MCANWCNKGGIEVVGQDRPLIKKITGERNTSIIMECSLLLIKRDTVNPIKMTEKRKGIIRSHISRIAPLSGKPNQLYRMISVKMRLKILSAK